MELRLKNTLINLPKDVDANKFMANSAIATIPEEAKKVFTDHGYDLSEVPGCFVKIFDMNEVEVAKLEECLTRIDEWGMKRTFEPNLQVKYFKPSFLDRLEICMREGYPYLNSDNTFASFLDNEEAFREFTSREKKNNPVEEIELNAEDKEVYNDIVQRLNYLILANPMDGELAEVVNNATSKVKSSIVRGEYKYLSIKDMVESIMFDGLELSELSKERISELISGAFLEESRRMV